ncbi:MAG: hypothetical protein ACRD16_02345 [Thermoanaerobaculia bacterium]
MVGRFWEVELAAPLDAEFDSYAGRIALPMVRGRMGCCAIFVLRDPAGLRRAILTFWLSRKAMAVAAASSEWEEVARGLSKFGITFDLDHGRAFESTAHFFAGDPAAGDLALSDP